MACYDLLTRQTLEESKEEHICNTRGGNLAQEEICKVDVEISNRQEDEVCHRA